MRKLFFSLVTLIALAAFGVATAEAANPATINVTVTITKTLSVSLNRTAWAVGSVAESNVRDTGVTGWFSAANDSNSSEDLTTTVGASSPSGWAAGAAPGADVFVMEQSTDGVIWANLNAGASLATGLAKDGSQIFDLRFTAPSSTDNGGTEQTIVVTVTAS